MSRKEECYHPERGVWNATKGLLWKILSIGGGKSTGSAWMIYSMARALVDAKIKKTFVTEPEADFVRTAVKTGQVCIDIGANVGSYTHLLSTLVGPSGQVRSIEPIPGTFAILLKRVAFFRLKNVWCYPVGLGARVGVGEFVGGTGRPGQSNYAHLKAPNGCDVQAAQKVPLTTLDRLVADQGLEKVDFIKCDVEGSELMVFRGGQNVLTQYRPIVLCEVEERWMRYGHTTADVFLLFHALKYRSFVWREGRPSAVNGALPHVNNYLFLPLERVDAILLDNNNVG